MGLTTHILDTANGRPAVGVDIRLYAVGETRSLLASAVTNSDGRTDSALIDGDLLTGSYELEFDVGDLLDVRGIQTYGGDGFSLRAYVANTLAYRRRKGTAAVLEQLARDVTGWPARAASPCPVSTSRGVAPAARAACTSHAESPTKNERKGSKP